ncbi:MAG: hypothetical protein ABI877_11020 [Gemmatimonadaceae bacterium]
MRASSKSVIRASAAEVRGVASVLPRSAPNVGSALLRVCVNLQNE